MTNWFGRRTSFDAENVVGNFVNGDVNGYLIQQFIQGAPPDEPTLPWRELPTEFDPFRFLSWRARLTPLIGREAALNSLLHWAEQGGGVKIRFLTGAGGTGKSRVAAELAAMLREKNWSAGFAALDKPAILPVPREGMLWIADYPEENRSAAQDLMRALARMEDQPVAIRLLFLSRRSTDWWQSDVDAAHAAEICDAQATKITTLDRDETVNLYRIAYERIVKHLNLTRLEIEKSAVQSWWTQRSSLHGLPLFTIAAAMQSAVEGIPIPTLEGDKIVQALVRRERLRIDNLGRHSGFVGSGLSRIVGLAAIPGKLLSADLRHFANPQLEIGTPSPERIVDSFAGVPWWEDESLVSLTPDVLAAELLLQVVSDRPDQAAAWLGAAIAVGSPQWVSRIERLSYDIKRVRGPEEDRISGWLAKVLDVADPPLEILRALLLEPSHNATLPLAVRVAKCLAGNTQLDEALRASWLHNGATVLARAGDTDGALDMIQKAVEIHRKLVASRGSEFVVKLASDLDSLSNRFSEVGDRAKAVAASSKAITILSKVVAADLSSDQNAISLANALNNHSAHLDAVGKRAEAIEAIEASVELYRQLAKTGQRNVEPELANALNNLAQLLPGARRTTALQSTKEAIEILEGLTLENPPRFEPKLAGVLKTASILRAKEGNNAGALDAAKRAVEILERLHIEQPERFASDLAIAFETLSLRLNQDTESSEPVETLQKAITIWRGLAVQNPTRFEPDLARSLDHLTAQLRERETALALASNEQAVDLWRQLAKDYPDRFKPDLAKSLNNLSNLRSASGDKDGGYEAAKEAHEAIRAPAEKEPARFSYELAVTLMTLHNRLVDLPNGWPFALMAIAEAVDILRRLVQETSVVFESDLCRALMSFSVLLDASGDSRRDAVIQEASEFLKRLAARKPSPNNKRAQGLDI